MTHPSRKKVKEFNLKIKKIFRVNQNAPLLINQLNPSLRGWGNYFGITHTYANFVRKMKSSVVYRLLRWTRSVHPKRSAEWRIRRYFEAKILKVKRCLVSRKWVFVAPPLIKKESTTKQVLFSLSTVKAPGWKRLTTRANPYSFEWYDYFWSVEKHKFLVVYQRQSKLYSLNKKVYVWFVVKLWLQQKSWRSTHHSPPKSVFQKKSDWKGKLQLLHQECHKELRRRLKR